jgi:transporter family-2 protein
VGGTVVSWILLFLPVIAGIASALQSFTNGYWAARIGLTGIILINGIVGLAGALAVFLLAGEVPVSAISRRLSPWVLAGALCGLVLLFIMAFSFPRIGAFRTMALFIFGQIITALLLDHYGALDLPEMPITPQRLLGALFLMIGVILSLYGV